MMIKNSTIELDLVHSDDLSVFSFSDDIEASTEEQKFSFPCGPETITSNVPFKVDPTSAVPVSDDDGSISNTSLGVNFHPLEEEPQGIEEMIAKLNQSMLKSARTRAIVYEKMLPHLTKKGLDNATKKSSSKAIAHKAQRTPCKKSLSSSAQRGCSCLLKLDGMKDNSISGFIRASKKW